ncbi:hypothetical protein AB0J83_47945 [Actinoplanes sp. NPDC049596]|uniref:hypothetical protein n=1 Tax=unclassified Actinoplanes TaxID=2626549 RepID=UPI0034358CFB
MAPAPPEDPRYEIPAATIRRTQPRVTRVGADWASVVDETAREYDDLSDGSRDWADLDRI